MRNEIFDYFNLYLQSWQIGDKYIVLIHRLNEGEVTESNHEQKKGETFHFDNTYLVL